MAGQTKRRRARVKSWWLLAAAGLVLAALACGRDDGAPPAIRIGLLDYLGGIDGYSTVDAAELAVGSLNAAGGLDGAGRRRRVELVFEDTAGLPSEAVDGARRLIQRGVVAILGPSRSRDALAAAGVVESARIPMICPTSTHPQTTAGKHYVFRMSFTDPFEGDALGRFAREELGTSAAAVLYDVASAYNRSLATYFRQAFEAAGGRIVAFETYTTGETDFRAPLERIRDARPEVLFLPNYNEDVPAQARQARDLGLDATLLGGDSWSLIPSAQLPLLDGAFFGHHWHVEEAATSPRAAEFVAAYRQAYRRDPTDQAALTYDAFGLLFAAIASAGTDPDQISQAIARTEGYTGVAGTTTFAGTGGDPARPLTISRIRDGGTTFYRRVKP